MNENNNCPLQSIRNFFDSEICKKVNYLQMFRLNKILKMVMHHGAYSQDSSIKKIVCLFFGINQYWACRVDLLFANSPVRANIFNPDQTAPKGNGSLQFCMLLTFP